MFDLRFTCCPDSDEIGRSGRRYFKKIGTLLAAERVSVWWVILGTDDALRLCWRPGRRVWEVHERSTKGSEGELRVKEKEIERDCWQGLHHAEKVRWGGLYS